MTGRKRDASPSIVAGKRRRYGLHLVLGWHPSRPARCTPWNGQEGQTHEQVMLVGRLTRDLKPRSLFSSARGSRSPCSDYDEFRGSGVGEPNLNTTTSSPGIARRSIRGQFLSLTTSYDGGMRRIMMQAEPSGAGWRSPAKSPRQHPFDRADCATTRRRLRFPRWLTPVATTIHSQPRRRSRRLSPSSSSAAGDRRLFSQTIITWPPGESARWQRARADERRRNTARRPMAATRHAGGAPWPPHP